MTLQIDADIIAYRCAASCEPTKTKAEREPLQLAIQRADELMYRILNETKSDDYSAWLSGPENFRKLLYPAYKEHRAKVRKPEWLQDLREFMVTEWKARITDGYEADDAIGIAYRDGDIIASIDKDLRQISGVHYNFVKGELLSISDVAASRNFWLSMLTGDRADNIFGVPGVGDVRAARMLDNADPDEYRAVVYETYMGYPELDFDLNYKLLRVLRDEEEFFSINENIKRQSKRQKPAETGGVKDPGNVPGVDSE